jgi:phage anti-repressor protein
MKEIISFKMPGVDFVLEANNVERTKAFEKFKNDIRGQLRKHKINNVHDDVLKKILNDGVAVTNVESRTAGSWGSDPRTVVWGNQHDKHARQLLLQWDSGTDFNAFLKNRDEEGNAGFYDFYDYGKKVVGTTMKSVIFPKEATNFYMTIDFELAKEVAAAVGGRRTSRKIHNKQYSRRTTSVKRAKSASRKYRNRK